jgi:hypothetical protein
VQIAGDPTVPRAFSMAALDRELDDRWRADRDYIIDDMNGSAVFLLAALKMRLTLAARRCGVGAEAAGQGGGGGAGDRVVRGGGAEPGRVPLGSTDRP